MSGRLKKPVMTTADMVDIYTVRFAIANSTGTLVNSTDMQTTVSGSSATGQFVMTLGSTNDYAQLYDFRASIQQAAGATGSYRLQEVASDPVAGTLTVQLLGGPFGVDTIVTGQSAIEATLASLTGSVFAVLRNTKRST